MDPPPESGPLGPLSSRQHFDDRLEALRRRLMKIATQSIGMLESSLAALWDLDTEAAAGVRLRDDRIDREEVEIEQEAFSLMTLQQPFGRSFRQIVFVIKVNADVERVADHACSIAKVTQALATRSETVGHLPKLPVSLREMGERVVVTCHALLRAVLDDDDSTATELIRGDALIDAINNQLFVETADLIDARALDADMGLLVYRIGRELERVGDLMGNVAEDIVYLRSGRIVRHAIKKDQAGRDPG